MRILAIVKNGEHKHQLRKLIEKGHTLTIVNTLENIKHSEIDVVVSLSEKTVADAFAISQQYNIPFYAHIDWIPPWMIFKDSEYNWGHIDKISFNDKMNFIRRYQNLAMFWSMADVKSMSANCFHDGMREITGIPDLTIYTRYPSPNIDAALEVFKNGKIEIKDEITCISKFLPHKRVHHLIKALQMIDYEGTLNLVGSGEERNLYEAIKGNLKINYVTDLDKYQAIARSRLVICLWNATVALEAIILGVPVITYDSKYMREICRDNVAYVTNNSISELSRKITEELNKKSSRKEYLMDEDNMLELLLKKTVGDKR